MADLTALVKKELENARLGFGEIRTVATPRRLAICVQGLPQLQPDAEITALGPARNIAFGADGAPQYLPVLRPQRHPSERNDPAA